MKNIKKLLLISLAATSLSTNVTFAVEKGKQKKDIETKKTTKKSHLECCICLDEINENDIKKNDVFAHCKQHANHKSCIIEWFNANNRENNKTYKNYKSEPNIVLFSTCPTCKKEIPSSLVLDKKQIKAHKKRHQHVRFSQYLKILQSKQAPLTKEEISHLKTLEEYFGIKKKNETSRSYNIVKKIIIILMAFYTFSSIMDFTPDNPA